MFAMLWMDGILDFLAAVTPVALLLTGVYFAFRLRLFFVIHPRRFLRGLFGKPEPAAPDAAGYTEKAPSPFRAACIAMAGTIGVGNITGVSLALLTGGPGAVFWMWVCAFAAMLLKYAEITLSMDSREKLPHGGYIGGTPTTLRRAGHAALGALFAALCLGYTVLVGGVVQANAISACLFDCFGCPPVACGLVLVAVTMPLICLGTEKTAALTARLVPLMCLLYIGMSLAVLALRAGEIPGAFARIFRGAFGLPSAAGGVCGYGAARAVRIGAARGLMSNEGGCGTAPLAHVTSDEAIPARQGLWGVFEVFADTVVICTLTALCILVAFPEMPSGVNETALSRLAFTTVLGPFSGNLLALSLSLFAFATILCGAFYGRTCLRYFTASPAARGMYLAVYELLLYVGAVSLPAAVWRLTDLLLSVMTLLNLGLLIKKADRVKTLTAAYGLFGRHGKNEAAEATRVSRSPSAVRPDGERKNPAKSMEHTLRHPLGQQE